MTVRFDTHALRDELDFTSTPHQRLAKVAALLAGCGLALHPNAISSMPSRHTESTTGERNFELAARMPKVPAAQRDLYFGTPEIAARVIDKVTPSPRTLEVQFALAGPTSPPPTLTIKRTSAVKPIAEALSTQASEPIERQHLRALGVPVPPPDIPGFAAEPLPIPPVIVGLTDASASHPAFGEPGTVPTPLPTPQAPRLRAVDIAQISDSAALAPLASQLDQQDLGLGDEPTLGASIAAMQVTPLPPARVRESDRTIMLAEAPTSMLLRIGTSALGKVDFRMSDTRTIDLKLSGLLDVLAGQFDATEFARLRNSASADAYVSFDQLRAMGLNVRYDAVYDDLRING